MTSYISSYLTIPYLTKYSVQIKPPIKTSSILVEFFTNGKTERITRIPTPLNYYSIVCELLEKYGEKQFYYSIEEQTPLTIYFYLESNAKQMYEECIEYFEMISDTKSVEDV